jgi:hypothetical protein
MDTQKYWTLDDLYTAISKTNLERLLGEIKPNNKKNLAWQRICFCCDKATKIVLSILGASYPRTDDVPAIVSECIVVLAALYLSAEGDMGDYTEKLQKRYKDSKETLMMLRDNRIPLQKSKNTAIYFGADNKEIM